MTAAPAPTPLASPAENFVDTAVCVGVVLTSTNRVVDEVSIVIVGDTVEVDGGGV